MRLTYRYVPGLVGADARPPPRRLVRRPNLFDRPDERAGVMRWEGEGGALAPPAAAG